MFKRLLSDVFWHKKEYNVHSQQQVKNENVFQVQNLFHSF